MSQLQKIKRKDLDVDKYSKALNDASNYRIYAEHWYLDILTEEKWECLVFGDYEVIMPIPLQYKFGIKFVLQPIYCQQLGVFYKEEISEEIFREFEKKLHKYRVRAYHFNEENTEKFSPEGERRVNQILNIDKPYEYIFKEYRKGRKSDINVAKKANLNLVKKLNIDELITLNRENQDAFISEKNRNKLKLLFESLRRNGKLIGYSLRNNRNENIAMCLLSDSGNRIILIFLIRNKSKKPCGEISFLLNEIFKDFSQVVKEFDFEGSAIPGVASFNESFGADKRLYTIFSNMPNPKLLNA